MKHVVVLGGAGLIGTHLCRRLIEEGCNVFCVDIKEIRNVPMLMELRTHDLFHYVCHDVRRRFEVPCDEIYNLASPARLDRSGRIPAVDILLTNITGSINALNVAHKEGSRVLYASSGDVYGFSAAQSFEEQQSYPTFYSAAAEAKRASEALHRAYNDEHGVDTRVARIFNTYGSGCELTDQRVVCRMLTAALLNRDITIYGSGEQLRTLCWVGDMVEGLINLMAAERAEHSLVVNLGSSTEISMRDLAELVIKITGSKSHITHITARPDDYRRKTPDLALAHDTINWSAPTSLGEGLKRTAEYLDNVYASHPRYAKISWAEML